MPEELIAYIPSLTGRAIDFYSCFISYSTKDQDFATRLHADLQAKGVRCWFAPHDVAGGKKLEYCKPTRGLHVPLGPPTMMKI